MTIPSQQRQLQQLDSVLQKCRQELSSSDTNTTDGYLSLYEYEAFVNERYYKNCSEMIVVSESMAQWEAFTLLACHSCLEESPFVDTIPDCCLPFNNSRIAIQSIVNDTTSTTAADWLERICQTADQAAVEDQCYTAPPTMAPTTNPFDNTTSNITNNKAVSVFANETECAVAIVDVDGSTDPSNNNTTTTPDGTISKIEFYTLLQVLAANQSHDDTDKNITCTVTNDTAIIDAVYVNLVCASCTYSSAARTNIFNATARFPDLNCCTSPNATISIVEIATVPTWLTRICTTIESMITCIDTTTTTTTPTTNSSVTIPTLTPTTNMSVVLPPMAAPTTMTINPSNATTTASPVAPVAPVTPTAVTTTLAPVVVPPSATPDSGEVVLGTSGGLDYYHDSTTAASILLSVIAASLACMYDVWGL